MPDSRPCFCCRPDCYECNPELWMARVNADFEANADEYQRQYDEAEAVPMTDEQIARMHARVRELIRNHDRDRAERARIAGSN